MKSRLRIFLTRHGETVWNAEHRVQGHTDLKLNDRGISQAERLAARIEGLNISTVFSSDLSRAADTAKILLKKLPGAAYHSTFLLRERNWGVFEGKTWQDIESHLPEEIRELRSHPVDFRPEGGESRRDVLDRIEKFVGELIENHWNQDVILVTHGGVSSLLIKYMTGMDLANITPFRIENCSISVIDRFDNGAWLVQCLNDMSHLEELKII